MKKQVIKGMLVIALAFMLCSTASATTGITNVDTPTKDEILTMYNIMNLSQSVAISYDTQPDTTYLTTSGELSDATLQNALDTLNFVRYIAGLSYDVTLSETYTQYCQDGALVLSANGALTHTPTQPSGMSSALYRSGYAGTSNGNISSGYSNLATNIISGWMADYIGESNLTCVGHRRWCLNPVMTSTGFGYVGRYSAMYASDNYYAKTTTTGIVWPAQTMPVEYFKSYYPWSYSAGKYLSGTYTVVLTNETSGQVWTMSTSSGYSSSGSYALVENSNYGQTGCIIFRPSGATYNTGDVYSVVITSSSGSVLASYTVDFFSLSDSYTPVSTVSYNGKTVDMAAQVSGASSWAQEELVSALNESYPVTLYQDKFKEDMTRGEFAYMLGKFCAMEVEIDVSDVENVFTDLGDDSSNAERNKYILYLYDLGIIDGTSSTTFDPDAMVTRQQIAKMLLAYESLFETPTITQDITGYDDFNQISSWAVDGVSYMNQLGVLNGNTATTLNPKGDVTVQEAALMCYRLFSM